MVTLVSTPPSSAELRMLPVPSLAFTFRSHQGDSVPATRRRSGGVGCLGGQVGWGLCVTLRYVVKKQRLQTPSPPQQKQGPIFFGGGGGWGGFGGRFYVGW